MLGVKRALAGADDSRQAELGSGQKRAGVRALGNVSQEIRLDVRDVATGDRDRSLELGTRDSLQQTVQQLQLAFDGGTQGPEALGILR